METREEKVRIVIGGEGDFNARMGRERGEVRREVGGKNRNSKDEKVNEDGRKLCEFLEKQG